jgi:predicted Zn-dependent protease
MNSMHKGRAIAALVLAAVTVPWLASCAVNPVTGEKELTLVSEAQERQLGQKNYAPYRQAQGGDYVVDPALVRYVQGVGQRIAVHADRQLPYEFSVVNDGTPNAWALPGGKIAINRGLLTELNSEAELAAVLSHEIVHSAARHSAQSIERDLFFQGALAAAGMVLGDSAYAQAGMLGAQLGTAAGQQYYSREAEREADSYGISYMLRAGYDPQAAVELQQTFVRLSEDKAPDWLSGLFASHPPSPERVENNRKLVAQLGNPGGKRGEAAYRQATARLVRTKPAYDAYAEARAAFEKKRHEQAITLVDKAIRIEPDEALFHALRGEIEEARGNDRAALQDYDRALALNPGYYRIPLARGLLQREMGRSAAARTDLERSNALLPTAEAHYGLGLIARDAGDERQAARHFQTAAQSDSPAGRAAARQLQSLGLGNQAVSASRSATQPGLARAIEVQGFLDRKGRLVVRLGNPTDMTLHGATVVVAQKQNGGYRELERLRLKRAIRPGEHVNLATGLGPLDPTRLDGLALLVRDVRLGR